MKKKSIFVYSIVVSAIFALSLIAFAHNIFQEYKNGERRAQKDFDNILLLIDNEDIENPNTQKKINFNAFSSLSVEKNNKNIIAYPSSSKINDEPTKFIKVYEIQVYKNNARYSVQASVFILRPEVIFNSAKTSFIIIAICTVLTTILIFFLKTTEEQKEYDTDESENSSKIVPIIPKDSKIHSLLSNAKESEEDQNDEPELAPLPIKENESPDEKPANESDYFEEHESETEQETLDPIPAPVPDFEESSAELEGNNDESDSDSDSDFDAPLITDQEREAINAITLDANFDEENQIPSGEKDLPQEISASSDEYETVDISEKVSDNGNSEDASPVTGIKWEKLLEKKLDEDLIDAGACEQDLSLFLICISNYSFTDSITEKLVSYLEKEFQTKDRIFEYKDNCFAIIQKDTCIEDAESIADSVQANITNIISENKSKCYIGISARTTRVLSASRLIMEADQALNHAKEEIDSPIIGFHVDIEKYKEYIKNL